LVSYEDSKEAVINTEDNQSYTHYIWTGRLKNREETVIAEISVSDKTKRVAKQLCAKDILKKYFKYFPTFDQLRTTRNLSFIGTNKNEKKRRYKKLFLFIGSRELSITCKYKLIWSAGVFEEILQHIGLLDEFNELFKQWYDNTLRKTHWLRFNCETKTFFLQNRNEFEKEQSFERGPLVFKDNRRLQETIDGYYKDLSKDVKDKMRSSWYKYYKLDEKKGENGGIEKIVDEKNDPKTNLLDYYGNA
jgi:hypothetical protein